MFPEFIPDDHVPHLPHLVAFGFAIRKWLKVQDFDDALSTKDVMVAPNPFAKTKVQQQFAADFLRRPLGTPCVGPGETAMEAGY